MTIQPLEVPRESGSRNLPGTSALSLDIFQEYNYIIKNSANIPTLIIDIDYIWCYHGLA